LSRYAQRESVNAAVLMSHNIRLDAEALRVLHDCRLGYLALLGPDSRRQRVLSEAGLTSGALQVPLAGPAGLDIGGELPETIALAILAECQAALHQSSARSLSGVLATEGRSARQLHWTAVTERQRIRSV
jgi:xanthine dehydrogenase accessory factor